MAPLTFLLTLPTFLNDIMPKILIKTLSLVSVIETSVYVDTKNVEKSCMTSLFVFLVFSNLLVPSPAHH